MYKKEMEEIKCMLFQLMDAILLEKRYNTEEEKCRNFEFATNVIRLAREEQDWLMGAIVIRLDMLLPKRSGLVSRLTRYITFRRNNYAFDLHYPFQLKIRGYETESQVYYCLRCMFRDVGIRLQDELGVYWTICGYSKYLDVFYIDIEVD